MSSSLMRRKPIEDFGSGTGELNRSMTMMQLALLGVGATVGTGIFVIFGTAVPKAGPAVVLSFLLASLVAGFTALCYAELSATLPVSGSSYSYAYAALGEIVAFAVAVLLLFGYAIAAAAVSVGWSEYLNVLVGDALGTQLPTFLTHAPNAAGFGVNGPAVVLILICGCLLSRGASASAKINALMVAINLGILIFFAVIAFRGFQLAHFTPFLPNGWGGVAAAGGTVFFTFVGLDAICTAGEEVKNPQKSLPRALVIALVVVTFVYALVAVAAVGAQRWELFAGQQASLAVIVQQIVGARWPGVVLAVCAMISIFSCTLMSIFGQTRILFAMSRDGMLPSLFHRVNARQVPLHNTWIVIGGCVLLAGFVNLDVLANLVSMGMLLVYAIVSIGVIVLRHNEPDRPRGFKVPGYPVTPILTAVAALYLVSQMDLTTWVWCLSLLGLGAVVYFRYSRHHSVLGQRLAADFEAARERDEAVVGGDLHEFMTELAAPVAVVVPLGEEDPGHGAPASA